MERKNRYIKLTYRIERRNRLEERGKRRIAERQQALRKDNKTLRVETGQEQGRIWVLYRSQNKSLNSLERTCTERRR